MTATRRTPPSFPSAGVPADAAEQKLLGLYPQRQEGYVLQRVRIPGGRLSPARLRALVDAARAVGARDALHLTTRQCIELHGLEPDSVGALHRALADAGVTTLGAAGDTVRNSTVDPLGGVVAGSFDLHALAGAADAALAGLEGVWALPRKFKVSFSGSLNGSMRPWATDLGIVAGPLGTFTAIVAGSLGAKPGTGIRYREGLSADDVVALAVAAVRLHDAEGDREMRSRARLRHVRERMGDESFIAALDALFAEEQARERPAAPAAVPAPARASDRPAHIRLAVPRGDLPLADAETIAAAVESAGGEIRVGIEHDLYLIGVTRSALPRRIRAWCREGRVVACPGTALCSKAAGPTHEAAEELAPLAADHPELLFAISGCPNSCAHAAIADVGLTARMKRDGEERRAVYRIAIGGDVGAGPALAAPAASDVPLGEVAGTVARLLGERAREGPA